VAREAVSLVAFHRQGLTGSDAVGRASVRGNAGENRDRSDSGRKPAKFIQQHEKNQVFILHLFVYDA
jgi:hypothetical protein